MKSLILVVSLLLGSISAFAGTCNLDTPIPLNSELLKGVHLTKVVLDEAPKFMPEDGYDSGTDVLEAFLFNIEWNNVKTGFVGASIKVLEKMASLGFSEGYTGNFKIEGAMNETNGVKTYTTKEARFFTEPQHAKNEAVTHAAVTVANGNIVAVNLTFPLYKVWKVVDGTRYISFTGEHQTVCVKSAR